MRIGALLLAGATVLAACVDDAPTGIDGLDPEGARIVRDEAVGVTLAIPDDWRVHRDPVLFNTYGFVLFDPRDEKAGSHERSPVARVALAYGMKPGDIEGRIG